MQPLGWPRELLKRAIKLSATPFDCGWHVTRYSMYKRIGAFFEGQSRSGKILSISGSDILHGMFRQQDSEIVVANYPEYNILSLPFPDESFDYVVSDQVLEHVEGHPQQAVDEQYRLLKPGGWLLLSTCLMNPIHGAPGDFWRFTPHGLRLLCQRFSYIDQAEGWGNAWVHIMQMVGVRGVPIPHATYHPLHWIATHNDPTWPVMTWIIARK
jgi:SAM-dependent methyltransferase